VTNRQTHTHTLTRSTALFPGLPGWADTRKVKPIWILLKQETVSGSGISWAICMSAPCSRMTTTQAPQHSVFTGRMPFLSLNQQRQSTEGNNRQTDRWTKKHRPYYTCSSRPHLTLFTGSRRKKRFYAHVSVSSYSDGVFVYFIMILLWCGTVNLFLFLVLFALFQGYWTSDRWNNASSWSTALWISQRTLPARSHG